MPLVGEQRRVYNAWYYKHNAKRIKKRTKLWKLNNPEATRKHAVDYLRRNPKIHGEWLRSHPEKVKTYNSKRRTAKTHAGGAYTSVQWAALCEKCHNRCLRCGKKRKLTADHVIPVSKGGSSNISNIQPLCKPCNCSKGTKVIDYRKQLEGPANHRGRN